MKSGNTFTNKVALVTGATSGIGRATAIAFARMGAKVVVSGRRENEGNETVALIRKAGGEAAFVKADVSSEADVAALAAKALSTYGRLDAAFNNAGVEDQPAPVHEQTVENYHHIMNTNVLGVFLSLKHEIAAMLKNGGGAIVNNSSVAGLIGFPGGPLRGQQACCDWPHQIHGARIRHARYPCERRFAGRHRDTDVRPLHRGRGD